MKTNILVQRRKLLGYSQQDVAEKVGIDRSYYTKIENGLTPSVKVAKAIGYHLGFDWTIFFDSISAKTTQNTDKEAI
ncbi:helix-turn-helix transcriptional regulator [Caldifermentibacillus hisashii]|uniref:helix-turn-helix transcriptional regulator n=1 Tax=Caldifermentibacillus hisashii TaxID=996558 RepID=UPI003100FBC6